MERKMYQLTEQQLRKCRSVSLPSDDEIKAAFARRHHGVTRGWGMLKRDMILSNLKFDAEYQRGLWQGRVDKANGLSYSEERNDNHYNLGYYRGYTEYESDRRGWNSETREWFDSKYLN
jgi:hypothetical protein